MHPSHQINYLLILIIPTTFCLIRSYSAYSIQSARAAHQKRIATSSFRDITFPVYRLHSPLADSSDSLDNIQRPHYVSPSYGHPVPSTRSFQIRYSQQIPENGDDPHTKDIIAATYEYSTPHHRALADQSIPGRGRELLSPNQSRYHRSEVITLGQSSGQYFAVMKLGTPAIDVALIVDSGSALGWVQCEPCDRCGAQNPGFPIFDPSASATFATNPCGAGADGSASGKKTECEIKPENSSVRDGIISSCTAAPSSPPLLHRAKTSSSSEVCGYSVTYADNSTSFGWLSNDTLTLISSSSSAIFRATDLSGALVRYPGFVFGCGTRNEGIETRFNASGMLGLNRGALSITSQLGLGAFAYCLPSRFRSPHVSGYLTFGGADATNSSSSSSSEAPVLKYTPMIRNTVSAFTSQFYYLGVTGVSVRGRRLGIPASAWAIDPDTGDGGTVIDSGTTVTALVEEAYSVFVEAFHAEMDPGLALADRGVNGARVCYEASTTPAVPNVTFHLRGNVDLELRADHLFRIVTIPSSLSRGYRHYCLAFGNAGKLRDGAKNFIGNIQQQDFLVHYDLAASRIGFAPTLCNPPVPSEGSPVTISTFAILIYYTYHVVFMVCIFVL